LIKWGGYHPTPQKRRKEEGKKDNYLAGGKAARCEEDIGQWHVDRNVSRGTLDADRHGHAGVDGDARRGYALSIPEVLLESSRNTGAKGDSIG